jgi:hypothetical protein
MNHEPPDVIAAVRLGFRWRDANGGRGARDRACSQRRYCAERDPQRRGERLGAICCLFIPCSGDASASMAALDRSAEGCVLAGLDGWDDAQVNSAWHCTGRPDDYRVILLKNDKVVGIAR